MTEYGLRWEPIATVVESVVAGQQRIGPKSKVTKPLVLAVGEVYLPISLTGSKMRLVELPEASA